MDLVGNIAGAVTPIKDSSGSRESRSKNQEIPKLSENRNPNFKNLSPGPKPTNKSPLLKSAKAQKSAVKNPNPIPYSPRKKIRERKFVVAKKKSKKLDAVGSKVDCKCKAKVDGDVHKCLCVAYENLRASQEEFFKNRSSENKEIQEKSDESKRLDRHESELEDEIEKKLMIQDLQVEDGFSDFIARTESNDHDPDQVGSSTIKRRRDRLLEEARKIVPETGSGRVMHLVSAFEKLLSLPKSKEGEEENKKAMKWAMPGLQLPKANETAEESSSSSSVCPLELCLTAENLGLDPQISISSSWDSSRASISSRSSNAGRRSRRNSTESSGTMGGRRWRKKQVQPRVTSQKPFNLLTEQRGKMKEEELTKKIHEMMTEEEKQRIPIAQGLPWTTDEPECLVKPPVKECTRAMDLVLHSDIRAVERAEFDDQVAEKMSLIEQYKMERERQLKMIEEEELRRLRKELVPKAQPMPYFDRPFIPKRSIKQPTIPKEPRFHVPEHKKFKCWSSSWSDVSSSHSFRS